MPERAKPRDPGFWRSMIGRHAASGLTLAAFCARESLSVCQFSKWKSRLQARCGGRVRATPSPAFLPVRMVSSEPDHAAPAGASVIELVLRDGRILRFPARTEAGDLARMLAVLEGQMC